LCFVSSVCCVNDLFLRFERAVHLYIGLTLLDILMEMHSCLRIEDVSKESREIEGSQWKEERCLDYQNARMTAN
jgi:hypothetical protein